MTQNIRLKIMRYETLLRGRVFVWVKAPLVALKLRKKALLEQRIGL